MRLRNYLRWHLVLAGLAPAMPALAGDGTMAVRDAVRAPPAFYQFCARDPAACRPVGPPIATIPLTSSRLRELSAVTRRVNQSVRETPDYQQFGREDVWSYPVNGKGDCEDYVLEKRRELIAAGWPSSVLLITVVRDEHGDGHAVLTIASDRGDLVLDSRNDDIKAWSKTPYTYYTRQAGGNPLSFVTITSANPSAVGVAAAAFGKPAAAAGANTPRGKEASNAGGNGRGAANGFGRGGADNAGNGNAYGGGSNNAGGSGGGSSNAGGNGGGSGSSGGGSSGNSGGNGGGSDNSGGGGNSGGGSGGGNGHGAGAN